MTSALKLLVGSQEKHRACKNKINWCVDVVVWSDVQIAYRPADATTS